MHLGQARKLLLKLHFSLSYMIDSYISERISWMRDLFSGCAYVRTYVRGGHARNVNLHSCSGIEHHWSMHYTRMLLEDGVEGGQHLWAMEDGEDSTASSSQRTYLVESSAETSAECSRWLVTLRSLHCRSKERKKRTGNSSKVESTHKPGVVLWLPRNQQCTISDTCYATRAPVASTMWHWHMPRCEAYYACVYS